MTHKEAVRWLAGRPSLEQMRTRCPQDWAAVEHDLAEALARKSTEALDRLLLRGVAGERTGKTKRWAPGQGPLLATRQLVGKRMTLLALEKLSIGAVSGAGADEMRYGRRTRILTSLLFQDRRGNRKAVSSSLFRFLWPLVPEKARFLLAAQTRGSYCFFSDRLIGELKLLIGGRRAIEIAAGDGTLSRLLRETGVVIEASDDRSWHHAIDYPPFVAGMDAETALRELEPEVVVCCWPPAANGFEHAVFESRSVVRYIVLGSAHEFASGAWKAYAGQTDFVMRHDAGLSALVLPPEAGTVVRIFDRVATPERMPATLQRTLPTASSRSSTIDTHLEESSADCLLRKV